MSRCTQACVSPDRGLRAALLSANFCQVRGPRVGCPISLRPQSPCGGLHRTEKEPSWAAHGCVVVCQGGIENEAGDPCAALCCGQVPQGLRTRPQGWATMSNQPATPSPPFLASLLQLGTSRTWSEQVGCGSGPSSTPCPRRPWGAAVRAPILGPQPQRGRAGWLCWLLASAHPGVVAGIWGASQPPKQTETNKNVECYAGGILSSSCVPQGERGIPQPQLGPLLPTPAG